jgi:Na+/H+-translocating membrane pyrophosphatase
LIRRGFSEIFLGFSLDSAWVDSVGFLKIFWGFAVDSAWVDSVGFLVACRAHSHGLEVTHGLAAGLEVTHGQGSVLGLPCLIPAGLEVTHGLGLPPGVAGPTGMSFAN